MKITIVEFYYDSTYLKVPIKDEEVLNFVLLNHGYIKT